MRAYGLVAVLMFALPLLGSLVLEVAEQLLINPGAITNQPALETVLVYAGLLLTSLSPVTAALNTQQLLVERQAAFLWTDTLASSGGTIPMLSPWIVYTILYLALAALLVMAAVRRTRQLREPA